MTHLKLGLLSIPLAVLLLASGCVDVRQMRYVPVGWQQNEDGRYVKEFQDGQVELRALEVNPTDTTFTPAIIVRARQHQISLNSAILVSKEGSFTSTGQDQNSVDMTGVYPMALHWEFPGDLRTVAVLDGGASIKLSLDLDGAPRDVTVQLRKK